MPALPPHEIYPGPVLLLAGPGTGKTHTLAWCHCPQTVRPRSRLEQPPAGGSPPRLAFAQAATGVPGAVTHFQSSTSLKEHLLT